MKKKYLYIMLCVLLFILLDQVVKSLVVNLYDVGEASVVINNFFKIYYIRNYGAAFGIFSSNILLLIGITCVMIYYIIIEIKNNIGNRLSIFSLILILSGAIGNLIDRVFRGYVVDFLSFTLLRKEMPIFNVADMFITIGVFLLIYSILRDGSYDGNSNKRRR